METVAVTVTFGKSKLAFHLKLITLFEEQKMRQRLLGLSEEERQTKSFEMNVSTLIEYEGAPIELTVGDSKTEISAKDYFKDSTVSKERIANFAVLGFCAALQPSVDFN